MNLYKDQQDDPEKKELNFFRRGNKVANSQWCEILHVTVYLHVRRNEQ